MPILLAVALFLGGCSGMTPGPAAQDPLARLLAAGKAGSDDAFRHFLAAHKHREDLPAPAGLRRLLLSRQVLRLQFGLAYRREDSRESLSWWLGEIGLSGGPEEVREYLKGTLASQGFQAADSPNGMIFTASRKGIGERVEIEGPHPWTGGRETACGIRLLWKLGPAAPSEPLTLGELLRRLPHLRDARVDAPLMEALSGLSVAETSVGGTWTRYYSWEATLSPAPGEAGPALRSRLRGLLEAAGYTAQERRPDHEQFTRARTGSYALLYDPDQAGGVRLSLQPES